MDPDYFEKFPTLESLKELVAGSKSRTALAKKFYGRDSVGSTDRVFVSSICEKAGLDTSHFKVIDYSQYMKVYPTPKQGHSVGPHLAAALIQKGVKYSCAGCRKSMHQGMMLPLEVDHINGDAADCRFENLRFLCPNCHSLQPTSNASRMSRYFQKIGLF